MEQTGCNWTIWCHLYNLTNVKNTHGFSKVTLPHGCFSRFYNFSNGTKSRKASHMSSSITHEVIEQVGEKVTCFLYNSKKEEAISELKKILLEKNVSTVKVSV